MPRKNYRVLHQRVMARPGAPERVAALRDATLVEMGLYQLRRSLELSQVDLAGRLDVTQSAVSKIEHADDLLLSTLSHYIEALGGRLELHAAFEDRSVRLLVGD